MTKRKQSITQIRNAIKELDAKFIFNAEERNRVTNEVVSLQIDAYAVRQRLISAVGVEKMPHRLGDLLIDGIFRSTYLTIFARPKLPL